MKKQSISERAGDFMAGKGFYIVLLLCVAALGVSGYYLFSGMTRTEAPVSGTVSLIVTATPAPAARPSPAPEVSPEPPATAAPTPEPAPTLSAEATPPVQTPAPDAMETRTATASVFTWPVKGEVARAWSVETLAYDETMGDWRIHDGIDINVEPGTPVMAPAGGTVSDIYQDDLMGTTVMILHANDVVSFCSNLEEVPSVEVGQTVRTGDVIGSVGATALAESAQRSHLHLNMTKGGVSVDPVEYLPKF